MTSVLVRAPDGTLIDAKKQLIALDQYDAPRSLAKFIQLAWPVVEPGQPYKHNWHIDLLCAHLEAITKGIMVDDERFYNRLLINVPPGAMKSLITNVFWPAWEWGPRRMPCACTPKRPIAISSSTGIRNTTTW